MNAINAIPVWLEPQYCDAKTFFDILDRIDLTALKAAITGPRRRGPNLKQPDATVRLILWQCWLLAAGTSDPPTVAGLRRELEDPESELATLCRFGKGEKLPDRKTIANHIERMSEHRDLVRDVQSKINGMVACTPPGKPSSPSKTSGKEGQRKEPEPKNRDEENVGHRQRRRREALGDREFILVAGDEASAEDIVLEAIHGDRPQCHVCPDKKHRGWECTKNHPHGVVVEMPREPDQSRQWKCRCCEQKLGVTPGTAFHGTHFSCLEILIVLRYIVHFRCGLSAQDVAGFLNQDGRDVSEGAARMLMHRLRECMREKTFACFAGETEIDEMLLRLNDGRQVSILTAYNRPTGRVRLEIIERKGGKSRRRTSVRC